MLTESTFPTGSITINVPGLTDEQAIVPLPPGALACGLCGIAVEPPHEDIQRLDLGHEWRSDPAGGAGHSVARHRFLDTALCASCTDIRDAARHALQSQPVIASRLGSVASERLIGALAAHMATGQRMPTPASVSDIMALIVHVVGGPAAAWAAQRRPGECAATRWAHVSLELSASLRDQTAAAMKARIDANRAPKRTVPPAEADRRGCGMCGVDAVASAPGADPWRMVDLQPGLIGGTSGERLWVALCPTCTSAIDRFGVGQRALLSAAAAAAGHTMSGWVELQAHITGYAAMPATRAPSPTPFAWLDLDALREDMRRAGA